MTTEYLTEGGIALVLKENHCIPGYIHQVYLLKFKAASFPAGYKKRPVIVLIYRP